MVLDTPPAEQAQPKFWRKPLDLEVQKVPKGIIHIIVDRCKDCCFCIEFCPRDILEKSDRYNRKGYKIIQVVEGKEDLCVACKHCEDICPEFAIWIEEVKT